MIIKMNKDDVDHLNSLIIYHSLKEIWQLFLKCLQMIKYFMSNYIQLIQRIFSQSKDSQAEALKKLIYLSVNDQNKFSQHVPQIAKQLPKTLNDIEDQQVKLLSLQLLSEMATNFTSKIPAECYSFPQLVALLSDQNPQVRKASHYLILIFIKKYEQIDEVIQGYLQRIHAAPQHWKVLQKIIHSFQSLLVIQPKCITYSQDYSHLDDFMRLLLDNRTHQHSLVQKASQQTVNSFVKNQYVPQVLPKLDKKIMKELVQYAQKISITLQPKRKSPYKQLNKDIDDIQQIKISHRKTSVLQQLMLKLDSQSDWKIKSQTIQQISAQLTNGNSQLPQDLIQKVLDLTYDYNFKTCITAMNVLLTIVTLYPHKISNKHKQIEDVVIDKICDLKMAVRQLANKILRNLYPNQSKDFLKRILTKLNNCSVVGKQQILNFFQQVFSANIVTDLNLVLSQISNQLSNQNTRVKIKTIDCLVKISTSNQLQQCKMILSKKLNKVYYDMFLQRLKEKMGVDKPQSWDEKIKLKKGLTWQAPQRPIQVNDQNQKQATTKIQFGNKKNFNQTQQDFAFANSNQASYKKQRTGLAATSTNSYKSSNTYNTFNTFKSTQDTVSSRFDKKISEGSQPSSFLVNDFQEQKQKEAEKKIPMKPTPIKKKTTFQPQKQQNPLVVHSKQYKIKNNDDSQYQYQNSQLIKTGDKKPQQRRQSIQDKPKMKINKNRDKSNVKIKQQQPQTQKQLLEAKQMATQPFSIKKSGSKKQHVIDYKATHYAAKDDLSPLDNPKQTLKFIMTNLPKDNDWNKQFQSLDFLRRLIKNHQDFYPTISQSMAGIMPQVLKLVESLRSSVAKNAMITLSQMCEALKKSMDPFIEPIFIKLFKKAQDANTFIVEQVKKCMTSLCTYCTTAKICPIIISNSNAKAVPIKLNVGLCIDKILQKKEYDCQILKQNSKIVNVMSNLIVDGSAQVRNIVKQIFVQLLQFNNSSEIQGIFKRASSKDAWEKWKNIIDKQATFGKR